MKNFRLLLICAGLLFLDIPTPFGACADNRTTLEINTFVVDSSSFAFSQVNSKIDSQTTTIKESSVRNLVEQAIETGRYYSSTDECYYDINVTSYTIESIILTKNDNSEIEITLPYEIAIEEDIINYKTGKRNFISLQVNISIEYEIIIPETQFE